MWLNPDAPAMRGRRGQEHVSKHVPHGPPLNLASLLVAGGIILQARS